jgi:hypothetical protein
VSGDEPVRAERAAEPPGDGNASPGRSRLHYGLVVVAFLAPLLVVAILTLTGVLFPRPVERVVTETKTDLAQRVAKKVANVGEMLDARSVVLPFSMPSRAQVSATGGDVLVSYYLERSAWDDDAFVEGVAFADPVVMDAAFSVQGVRSVAVEWWTDFLDQDESALREPAISATWSRATFSRADPAHFLDAVYKDPTRFYARSDRYWVHPVILDRATTYGRRLHQAGGRTPWG